MIKRTDKVDSRLRGNDPAKAGQASQSMIKRILIIAIAATALLIGSTMYAQKPEKKQPKEPKLLKEKKFDKKIKRWAGNVVVTEDSIVFLDKDGNVKKTKKLAKYTGVRLSKNGKRVGQSRAYDVTEKGPGRVEFKMMDENGNVLWETDNTFGLKYISEANDGTLVRRECDGGWCSKNIVIHDRQNRKGVKVTPDVNESAQSSGGYFSEDGKYFVVKYDALQKPDELVLFDVLAKKPLWVKLFEGETIYDIAVSPLGKYVSIVTKNNENQCFIHVFDKTGNLVLTQEIGYKHGYLGNYYFDFDNNEKYLVIASERGELFVFDPKLKKLLWKHFIGDKDMGFLDVDISANFITLSVTQLKIKDRYDGSLPRYLYVFDYKGALLLSRKFTDHGLSRWSEGIKVNLDLSSKKIRVILNDKFYEFENEFAK